MALGLIGIPDLSIVTDTLIHLLEDARDHSPIWDTRARFTIDINGSAPDTTRDLGDCVLSLYLLHVTPNTQVRNSPVRHHNAPAAPLTVPRIPFQPLGLDLYYLLTAWADESYVHEQLAMSVALQCFHENPIVRKTQKIGDTQVPEEFTITMEVRSVDDLGQLWQAVNVPARLATVYRVSVVFLTPPAPAALAKPAKSVGLTVGLSGHIPLLLGTSNSASFSSPSGAQTRDFSPAVVAPGDSFTLLGSALDEASAERVFLLDGSGEHDVTAAWNATATANTIVLTLPAVIGAPPQQAPLPGVHQVRVGKDAFRSNVTPFSVSARVSASGTAPFLEPDASVYSISGAGFIANSTELAVGGKALTETTDDPPNDGQFTIQGGGTSLLFKLPAAMPDGVHEVVVRVNGVQSAPAWWVKVGVP